MADASPLCGILTAEEFQILNDQTRLKLEEYLRKTDNDSSQLKIQLTKLKTQSEQQCFELDTQLQQLQQHRQQDEHVIHELSESKNRADAELAAVKEELVSLRIQFSSLERSSQEWKREKDALVAEKEDLSSLVSRRNEDLDRLTTDLKALTDQLVNSTKEKTEALVKMEELNGLKLALEYKEKRLDQERELMIKQQRLLQEELDQRTKEVMNIRREKTSIVHSLQADVAEKIEELRIAQKTVSELTSNAELQEKHIKELNDRLKELSETEVKMTENSRNELRSQMRLCELYKSSSEDAQAKADELTKATEELQRLLRDASARYGELETESKATVDRYKEQFASLEKANEELRKELERANGLLDTSRSRLLAEETIEAMSPSAAAASRLMKSGMTLTQIYSQYVSVSEQLLFKEEECKKLNSYIDQILQEIEERAPTITRQREDYEKSVEMVASLTRQLDLAVEEAEKEKERAMEARRLLGQVQRAGERHEKQVGDLSRQVCFLLRDIEELRGGRRMPDAPSEGDHRVTSSEEGSADAIISRHLVTFSDVEQLQERNRMLLAALREVTDKQDTEEKNAIEAQTTKMQQALENALIEVEHLRDTRRRHEEMMENVIEQRDTYRRLVQEAGLNVSRSPTKFRDVVTSTPAQQGMHKDLASSPERRRLNDSFRARMEETETKFQQLSKEKKETEKALNDKIQLLQDSLADVRDQNARMGTQIQYFDEKEKLLQGNWDSCKKQLKSLEEKNKMYAITVAKHEQSIAVLRDQAMNAQQALSRAEVNISMLREEKQLLRDAEARLVIERDSLLGEKRNQSLLAVNLESIKLNLERGEAETRMRLQNSLTAAEQQTELLRKKLEMEEQRYRDTVKSYEDRLEADRNQLKVAEENVAQAKTRLAAAEEKLAAAEARIAGPLATSPVRKAQLARLISTPGTPAAAGAPVENEVIGDLRAQLAELQTEAAGARLQLDLARQQIEQYRSIADGSETQLKESTEAAVIFKREMEQQLGQLAEERSLLSQQLEEAQSKLKTMEEGAAIQGQASANQTEEVSIKIARLESELQSLLERTQTAESSEARARADCLDLANQAREAQEKYERELVQHAADVEQLNSVREASEVARSRLAGIEDSLARVQEELNNSRSSWDEQRSRLESDAAEKGRRCAELDRQVDLMQEQIVTLSARMAAATRVHEISIRSQSGGDAADALNTSSGSLHNVSMGDEESRSADQLLELVRFLRREKEIAISRFEVMEAESQRFKMQLEGATRQLAEAQATLNEERERSATSILTSEKHTEMMRRLETLNALTDSNRVLREERSNLTARLEEITARATSLEAEVEPLRSAQRESSARLEELTAESATLRAQVETWRKRTNALQERAGRAAADDVKRLQQEKEQLQRQLDTGKEVHSKTSAMLTETQKTNTQLATGQQRLQEEIRKAREEVTKVQAEVAAVEARRVDEAAKSTEQLNQIRRIARKYKTQFEELKAVHDECAQKKPSEEKSSEASEAAAVADAEATAISTQATEATNARLQELEERVTTLTAEAETLRTENAALKASDEKFKNIMKATRQKLANHNALSKEKETMAAQLNEAQAKIESLEQSSEEANVRAAALKSQLEARLARMERENTDLTNMRQALEAELESSNQRLSAVQRQLELLSQQQQQIQQTAQSSGSVGGAGSTEKVSTEAQLPPQPPPTANIKPMASTTAAVAVPAQQRAHPPAASSSPVASRTTPTASIRPMAMTSRTVAVQPTSVAVSPMVPPPLVAITAPNFATASPIRQEEMSPASSSAPDSAVAGPSGEQPRTQKRSRETSDSPSADKRTRLQLAEEEEEEDPEQALVIDISDYTHPEVTEEYDGSTRPVPEREESMPEYDDEQQQPDEEEEQAAEEEEEQQNSGEEGERDEEFIESDAQASQDVIDVEEDQRTQEEPEQEIMEGEEGPEEIILEEPEEEENEIPIEEFPPVVLHEDHGPVPELHDVNAPAVVELEQDQQETEPLPPSAPGVIEEESIETEAFAPNVPSASVSQEVFGGARPPGREDRLPSFGRSIIPFEDVGGFDDGIVPSTPVLLRPRNINEGFAEAVSSPQVNTAGTRFVFGAVPELLSVPTGAGSGGVGHLESHGGMEETRMDLSHLEEGSGRSMPSTPHQVSPLEEVSISVASEEPSGVVHQPTAEEQADFEGGSDLESDAAAEFDLLADDDHGAEDLSMTHSAPPADQDRSVSAGTEEVPFLETGPQDASQAETAPPPVSQPTAPTVRPQMSRRGAVMLRGRAPAQSTASPAPSSRPVPITWTPSPQGATGSLTPQPAGGPNRVFRRSLPVIPPSGTPGSSNVVTVPGFPGVTAEPGAGVNSPRMIPRQPLQRGRGVARGPARARGPRRM